MSDTPRSRPDGLDLPSDDELAAAGVLDTPGRGSVEVPHRPGEPLKVERTRVSALWWGLAVALAVLVLLLVFILQNGQKVKVHFFGANGTIPLGVALLLAAVAGAVVVVVAGTARIVQLRLVARRHRKAHA